MLRHVFIASFFPVIAMAQSLTTEAEKTDFRKTGRYDEVERLCPAYAKAYPGLGEPQSPP